MEAERTTFPTEWLQGTSAMIEERIRGFLQSKLAHAEQHAPASLVLVNAICDMTMRSAKRIRPLLLAASYHAVRPGGDLAAIANASVASELLQTYMLIHDDWMDMDELRRGKPTVHVMMTERYGHPHVGASVAILAGNLACSYAWEVLLSSALPPEKICTVVRAFWEMQEEVVTGQLLDVVGDGSVSTVHALKTASYTVSGPLTIGAILGEGTEDQIAALRRYGLLLGQAFQMRDDILGLYGDPKVTGKPVGNDLRMGKRTALVEEALSTLPDEQRTLLSRALGNPGLTEADLSAVRAELDETGVRERVEQQVQSLLNDALAGLETAPLDRSGADLLKTIALLAANRQK